MADAAELEIVLSELAALREQVESLKRSVADARGRVALSMRDQVRCPHCGTRTVAHFETVPDFNYGRVHKQGLVHENRGIWRNDDTSAHLEAYVCTNCGAVEYWLIDTSIFADGEGPFKILTSEDPTAGPYR